MENDKENHMKWYQHVNVWIFVLLLLPLLLYFIPAYVSNQFLDLVIRNESSHKLSIRIYNHNRKTIRSFFMAPGGKAYVKKAFFKFSDRYVSVEDQHGSLLALLKVDQSTINNIKDEPTYSMLPKKYPYTIIIPNEKYWNIQAELKDQCLLIMEDIQDWQSLLLRLKEQKGLGAKRIWNILDEKAKRIISNWNPGKKIELIDKQILLSGLNNVINNKQFYSQKAFKDINYDNWSKSRIKRGVGKLNKSEIQSLNRALFECIFPNAISKFDRYNYIDETRLSR